MKFIIIETAKIFFSCAFFCPLFVFDQIMVLYKLSKISSRIRIIIRINFACFSEHSGCGCRFL